MSRSTATERLRLPDGREIAYTLTRKRVKNLNLRVRPDGSVAVSASPRVPEREIERFLQSRAEWIRAAQERCAKRREAAPVPSRFAEGETLPVFGEATPIRVERGTRICGAYSQKTLFLTVRDPDDPAQRRRAAEADFAPYRVPRVTVRYRRMTSRWGSCNTRTAALTFNCALIAAPLPAVEYVVYHEFAHLVHPDHSPAFYATVARFLPDWETRRAMLRAVPCRFF